MTAPTEAEIRAAVAARFVDNGTLNSRGILGDAFTNASGLLDDLYSDDLRQSEQDAMDTALWEAIVPIRDRAIAELEQAIVAAGLRFAAEHPDAPRAAREPVTA